VVDNAHDSREICKEELVERDEDEREDERGTGGVSMTEVTAQPSLNIEGRDVQVFR